MLRRLQPGRKAEDVFPVEYRMNTRRALHRLFPEPHRLVVYGHSSEPTYFGRSAAAWRMAQLADWLTPPTTRPDADGVRAEGREHGSRLTAHAVRPPSATITWPVR